MFKKNFFKKAGFVAALGMAIFTFGYGKNVMAAGVSDAKTYTDGNKFTVDDNGIITSYKGDDTEVVIPKELVTEKGVTVQVKGISGAFKDNKTVTNIIIPSTVSVFGDETFSGCTGLSSIDVYNPAAVVDTSEFTEYTDYRPYIYEAATGNLYEVIDEGNAAVIPAALTTLGEQVFNECCFNGFYVIDGNTCFKDSDEGYNDTIKLSENAGASLLSSDGKQLYKFANNYKDDNTKHYYTIPTGVEEIKPYAFYKVPNGNLTGVIISNTVKQIDEYAFYNNGIQYITFEENSKCEIIGSYAFAYCENMDIKLPPSVKYIYSYALAYIINRTPDISETSIEVMEPYIFTGCENLHTLSLPKTLKELRSFAFEGCDNLQHVIFLGKTLEVVGEGAFKDCGNLQDINIPEGVKNLENNTFSGCQNLGEIILPDSLEKIGDGAFANCNNIKVLVIPKNVKYISNTSFKGANTASIDTSKNSYVREKMNEFSVGKFSYVISSYDKNTGTGTVYVKGVSKEKYKGLKKITIPATVKYNNNVYKVTAIKAKAFKGMSKLATVKMGANIDEIGANAFAGCKNLKTVKMGKNVTKIGASAFKNCKALAKISIPANVKKIGNNAFAGCNKLKNITIKSKKLNSKGLAKKAFKGIPKSAKIKVPKNKVKAYKKLFVKKGLAKKAKVTK